MQRLYPTMLRHYKKYRSVAEPLVDDLGNQVTGRSNLFIPYPWAIVESELPRLAGKLPRIRVFPRKEIDRSKVERRQDFLYYVFDRMGFLKTQTLWLRQFAIYGWSPLYAFWRMENSPILTKVSDEAGNVQLVKKIVPKYDDFWSKVLDVWDCYLQPGATETEESDWFMFSEWVSINDIKQRVDDGLFYEEALTYAKEGKGMDTSESGRINRDALIAQSKDTSKYAYGKYEILYCFENGRVIASLNRSVLAMVGDNPNPLQEKPIINCNLMPLINEQLGIGTIEELAGLPDKLNALSNSRLDNISLQLGKVFLGNRNAQCDWENFVMDSGNIIFTDDLEHTVKELEFSDQGASSEREVLTTKEEMQFTSGVSDYIVGVKSGTRLSDTATGVSTIVRESNARYALKQASYESGALKKLVTWADAYSSLYTTDVKRVAIQGPDGLKAFDMSPEDLMWEADIMVEPGSSAPLDQITRREGLTNLLDRVMRMPTIVDLPKFVRELLESYDFRNADELIVQKEDLKGIVDDVQLAENENLALSLGDNVPLMGDAQIHLGVHQQFTQRPEFSQTEPTGQQKVLDHIKAHEMLIQQQQMAATLSQGGLNGQIVPNSAGMGGAPPPPQGIPGMGGPQGIPPAQGGPPVQ